MLRPYQKSGFDWLSYLRDHGIGALLADDMGLGKTLQSIAVLKGKSLIIAPTSVLYNWEQEISKFRPNLKCSIYHGTGRKLDTSAQVILTSFAILRLDLDLLSSREWDIVVVDEAQNIKNPDSKVSQAIYQVTGKFKLALTGTPVENRLEDLWSVFNFVNRGLLGSRKDFQKRYCRPIVLGDKLVAQRLRERLQPFIMRRLKTEVAKDLPPYTEVILYNDLSDEEREFYQGIEVLAKSKILDNVQKGKGVIKMLEALLRLRQSACHAGLVPGCSIQESSKVQLLLSQWSNLLQKTTKRLFFLSGHLYLISLVRSLRSTRFHICVLMVLHKIVTK